MIHSIFIRCYTGVKLELFGQTKTIFSQLKRCGM